MRTTIAVIIALVALALTGCAQTSPYAPSAEVHGDWRLAEAADADGAFPLPDDLESRPTLTIDEERSGGRTPCNRFGASVNGGLGEVSITPTTVTEAACADSALMALEARYLEALRAVEGAAIDDDVLTLTGGAVELRFDRVGEIAASELLNTPWTLESTVSGGSGDGTASSVLGEGRLLLSITGELSGNAGCRDFTARYGFDGATIVVTGLEPAAADCPAEFLAQEEHVFAVLGERFSTEIRGDSLIVTAEDGRLGLVYRQGDRG